MSGYLYFFSLSACFNAVLSTVISLNMERPVFLREEANKMYSILPYFATKIQFDIPSIVILSILMSAIQYFGVGLTATWDKFLRFLLGCFCSLLTGTSIGYFFSSLFDNLEMAAAVTPICLMPFALFGGFLSNTSKFLEWISWL